MRKRRVRGRSPEVPEAPLAGRAAPRGGSREKRQEVRRHAEDGVIPACAGNTTRKHLLKTTRWDHPRACGEHVGPLRPQIGGGAGAHHAAHGLAGRLRIDWLAEVVEPREIADYRDLLVRDEIKHGPPPSSRRCCRFGTRRAPAASGRPCRPIVRRSGWRT